MQRHVFPVLLAATTALACTHTLHVTVHNPPGELPYELRFQVKRGEKMPDTVGIGQVEGGHERVIYETFPADSKVTLQARKEAYVVWESGEYSMNQDRADEITITGNKLRKVDVESSVKTLVEAENRLKRIVALSGYQPVQNVMQTGFGSFVARPRGGQWFTVASPKLYQDGLKNFDWLKSAIGTTAVKIHAATVMNSKATAQAEAAVEVFEAKAGFTNSDLYEYGMDIDVVTVMHDDTFASAKAKLALSQDPIAKEVNAQLDKYIQDPRYEVAFVRGMHIFNQYQISYRRANRLSAEVNAMLIPGCYFEAGAAYAFDNSSENVQHYKDFVGGFLYESTADLVDDGHRATAAAVSAEAKAFAPVGLLATLQTGIEKKLDAGTTRKLLTAAPQLGKKLLLVGNDTFLVKDPVDRRDPGLDSVLLSAK